MCGTLPCGVHATARGLQNHLLRPRVNSDSSSMLSRRLYSALRSPVTARGACPSPACPDEGLRPPERSLRCASVLRERERGQGHMRPSTPHVILAYSRQCLNISLKNEYACQNNESGSLRRKYTLRYFTNVWFLFINSHEDSYNRFKQK